MTIHSFPLKCCRSLKSSWEEAVLVSSGLVSGHPKGYVLQNASRTGTLTQLLRAASLGFFFPLPFSVSVLWGNHIHPDLPGKEDLLYIPAGDYLF